MTASSMFDPTLWGRVSQEDENHFIFGGHKISCSSGTFERYFDRRTRETNQDIRQGDFVFVDPEDGTGKNKLLYHFIGPFAVLVHDQGTYVIRRDTFLERFNSKLIGPSTNQKQKS